MKKDNEASKWLFDNELCVHDLNRRKNRCDDCIIEAIHKACREFLTNLSDKDLTLELIERLKLYQTEESGILYGYTYKIKTDQFGDYIRIGGGDTPKHINVEFIFNDGKIERYGVWG